MARSLYSGVQTIDGKKYIWLQGIGLARAKPIEEFQRGDKIAYNYGESYTVIDKKKISKNFYELKVRDPKSGKVYPQKVKVGNYKPYFK
jgi:uncharacterized protein (DUF2147 family)